jgi:hypothetical protein
MFAGNKGNCIIQMRRRKSKMVQKVDEKPNETTRMGLISSELSPDQFHAII